MRPTPTPRSAIADLAGQDALEEALARRDLVGTCEFFVHPGAMPGLVERLLGQVPRPVLSLNRPHDDGRSMVHRAEWRGMVFTSVSRAPLLVC